MRQHLVEAIQHMYSAHDKILQCPDKKLCMGNEISIIRKPHRLDKTGYEYNYTLLFVNNKISTI